ncbi:hypothetical protein DD237_001478 [Peronospora effusa]|uniref:Tyrosinase copper-binding domain-containing protein n=1 Tax=Peronospora effusa TaxID=542832 RepID=A0A3R7XKM6_9STRA|nr:hypothetical protein DD237_001478 [Peronospora effusa]
MRLPSVIVVLGTMLLFAASSVSQSTTTTTDVYYPTILSAAGNITGLPGGNDLCGSERIRKPWSALRSDEQALYIEATKLAVADGGVAAFAAIAADSLSQAQGEYSCAFFSWYRRLLLAYESYLRTLDERFACLTLHYYDVHTAYLKAVNGDCTNMFDCSDIFQALGGNVKSNEITTSTFNGIEATGYAVTGFSSKNVVRNDLSTKFIPSAASFSTFQSVVATSVDYATFLQGIKYGVHDEVLNAIGGTFATAAAANDVLYYSWYTSLDMYWHVYHLCRIGVPLTNDEIVESLEVFANSTQTCGGVAGVDAETPLVMRIKVDGELVDVSKHPKLGKFFAFTGNLNWNYASIQQLGEYSYTYELPEMFRQQILSNNDMCTGFNRAFAATYTTLNATAVKSTMTTKTSTTTRTTTTTKIVNGKKVTTTKVSKVTTTSNRSSASTAYSTATTGQLMSRYNYTYLGNFSTGNVVFGEGTIVSNGYTGYKAYYSNGAITTKHNGIISTSASTTSGSIDSTYSKMSNMVMNVMVGTKSVARNVTVSVATSGSYWAWLSTAYNGLYTRFEGNVDLVATHMKLLECYTFERVYGLSNLTSTFVTDKNLVTDRVDCGQRMDLMRSGLLQLAVRSTSYSSKSLKFASSTVIKTILTSYKRVFTRNVSYIRRSYTQKVQNDLDSTEQSLDNITITSNSGLGNNETSSIVVNTGYIMSKTTSMTQQNAGISNTVTTTTTTTAANASDTLSEASSADDVRSTLGGNAKSITGPKTKMTGSNGKSVSTTTHPNDETTATTKSDSVHTTVTAGSGDLTTATGSSSPAASNTAMTPKTKSGATPPGATSAPVMPGATPSPVMPDATPAPVMPGATPAQVMPGTIPVPVMLGTTPAPVMPGAIPSLTTPDTTPSPVMPDATPAQMIPGATPAQVMPGTTPAPVMPGATPAPEIPGITPVPVMPGAIPAPTTPGATPAPVDARNNSCSCDARHDSSPCNARRDSFSYDTWRDSFPCDARRDSCSNDTWRDSCSIMPGATPAPTTLVVIVVPMTPGMATAHMMPGATPVHVMPGDTPVPTMPCPTPAPTLPCPCAAPTMPGAAPVPTMKHSETCINVSVEGDATYCIAGPICSGSGDSPNGSMCPMEGDVAVGDCHDTLASYQNSSTCIAPENARCAKTHTGVWGCVFDMRKAAPTPAPTTATYMATRSPATSESDKHTSLYSATPEMTKSAAAPCTTGPSEETATDVSTTTGIKTATTASTDQQEDYTIEKQHPSALSSSNQKLSTSYAATTLASGNSNSNSNSGNGGVTLVLSICAAVAAVVALAGFTVFKMKQRPSNTVASPGAYYIQPTTPNTDSTRFTSLATNISNEQGEIRAGGNAACNQGQRVRKSWSRLTSSEKDLYLEAMDIAIQNGVIEQFAAIHVDPNGESQAHRSCGFFSWHRRLLVALESYLRDQDPKFACVTLPYYDVHAAFVRQAAKECDNLYECSDILQEIGGNKKAQSEKVSLTLNGKTSTGYPIDGYPLNHNCDDTKVCGYALRSDLATKPVPSGAGFASFLNTVRSSSDYASFLTNIQFGVHNEVHNAVGGIMVTFASPRDIFFYSWHAAIDMYLHVYHLCHFGMPLTEEQILSASKASTKHSDTCGGASGVGPNAKIVQNVRVNGEIIDISDHPTLGKYFSYAGSEMWNYGDVAQLGDYSYSYELPDIITQQLLSNSQICAAFSSTNVPATSSPITSVSSSSDGSYVVNGSTNNGADVNSSKDVDHGYVHETNVTTHTDNYVVDDSTNASGSARFLKANSGNYWQWTQTAYDGLYDRFDGNMDLVMQQMQYAECEAFNKDYGIEDFSHEFVENFHLLSTRPICGKTIDEIASGNVTVACITNGFKPDAIEFSDEEVIFKIKTNYESNPIAPDESMDAKAIADAQWKAKQTPTGIKATQKDHSFTTPTPTSTIHCGVK